MGVSLAGRALSGSGAADDPQREAEGANGWAVLLGSFRGLAADLAWLRVHLAWERQDEAAVERWSDLATTLEPTAVSFWLNAARMVAHDFAESKYAAAVQQHGAWETQRRALFREQANRALARLERARAACGDDPRIWIEMGNIHLHRRDDLAEAARCYGRAADAAEAPLYARRIEAGLWWRLGQREKAVAALRQHHAALLTAPAGAVDPDLVREVEGRLSQWTRELEQSLNE